MSTRTTVSWREVSARAGRNDLPAILAEHWTDLSDDDLRVAVYRTWTLAEWPERAIEPASWVRLFDASGFQVDGRAAEVEDELPEIVTLYRGAIPDRRDGMSWTTNPAIAEMFAHRFDGMTDSTVTGRVYRMDLPRECCLAAFREGRGEAEVVVDVTDLDMDAETDERLVG